MRFKRERQNSDGDGKFRLKLPSCESALRRPKILGSFEAGAGIEPANRFTVENLSYTHR
jgi:hypothetical protein